MRARTGRKELRAISARTKPRWRRGFLLGAGSVAVLALIARLSAGWTIENSINRRLTRIPGYTGHVGTVYLHLWRGAYSIHDIEIKKKTGKYGERRRGDLCSRSNRTACTPGTASDEKRGVSAKTAKRRAWATVNKKSGGGKKSRRHK
jgi:hypothetical protein